MKRDQYIPHDVSLRNTSEVIHLIEKESASGYGLYWAIIEYLRTQDNYRGDLRALRGIHGSPEAGRGLSIPSVGWGHDPTDALAVC